MNIHRAKSYVSLVCLLAIACLSTVSVGAPNESVILDAVQHRYSWLPTNDEPAIETSFDKFNNKLTFKISYPKSKIYMIVDEQADIEVVDWNVGAERELDVPVVKQITPDFIWKQRPDLPRARMVKISDSDSYEYLRPDNVIDSNVCMYMFNIMGKLTGFGANNSPTTAVLPKVNYSVAQARQISLKTAEGYIHYDSEGLPLAWKYAFEQSPQYCYARILSNNKTPPYVAYLFTYRLGNEQKAASDKSMLKFLPKLTVCVNATTGKMESTSWSQY